MTVYVDAIQEYPIASIRPSAWRFGNLWCHLWSDTEAELDAMADQIGISRRHCQDRQNPLLRHYDLIQSKRRLAVAAGAVEMEFVDYLRAKRQEAVT